MQNGIFGLGQGIANAPNRYAEESDRFGMQGQQLRQQAANLAPPQMQAPNPLMLLLAALAASFDKSGQAGQQIAGGIQQGQQRNYENAFRANEAQRQGMLQQAEGFDLQARRADQRLGRFQDASQFAQGQALKREDRNLDQQRFDQKQAADTAQWWAQEGNRRREFQTKEKNDIEAIRLRGDAGEKAAALKTLRDPKSTIAARAEAMDALEDRHGYVFGPDQRKGYLESTYYQKGAEAGTEGKIAGTADTKSRTNEREKLLPGKLKGQDADNRLKALRAKYLPAEHNMRMRVSEERISSSQARTRQGDQRLQQSTNKPQKPSDRAAKVRYLRELEKEHQGFEALSAGVAASGVRLDPAKAAEIKEAMDLNAAARSRVQAEIQNFDRSTVSAPQVAPFNPLQGTITPTGSKLTAPARPPARQVQRTQAKKSAPGGNSQMAADKAEGLRLMKQRPDLRGEIQKRFKAKYKVDIGG